MATAAFAPGQQFSVGESFDDRALRAIIAVTMGSEVRQYVSHFGEFGDAPIKICHMIQRDRLHFRARARAVMPQRQQPPDIFHQKTKSARLTDKTQ